MTKTGSHDASDRRSNDGKNAASSESTGKTTVPGNVRKTESSDSGRNVGRRDENARFFSRESQKSATARKLSPDLLEDRIRRGERSATLKKEKSAVKCSIDWKDKTLDKTLEDKTRNRESRKLSSKDAGKSAVASATKTARKSSPEALRDVKDHDDRAKFIREESVKSATARAIDSKAAEKYTREATKDTRDFKRRSESPRFFCKESAKSATTYSIDSKAAEKYTREATKDTRDFKRRSESPRFFCRESEKSATTYAIDSKAAVRYTREATKDTRDFERRSESPRFFCKKSERSTTTYAIDAETSKRFSLESLKDAKERSDSSKSTAYGFEPKSAERLIREGSEDAKDVKRRSESAKFFRKESEKSAKTYAIDSKAAVRYTREATKDTRDFERRSESPRFFCKESERSATTYAIDAETSKRFSLEGLKDAKQRSDSPKSTIYAIDSKPAERLTRKPSEDTKDVKQRSESPRFFCKESERSGTTYATDSKLAGKLTRVSLKDIKDVKRRSESPRFFCKESERSATTYAIDAEASKRFPLEGLKDAKERSDSSKSTAYGFEPKSAERLIREGSEDTKDVKQRSESPRFFRKESERPAKAYAADRKTASPNSSKTRTPRSDSPKFFCKESEKSATTYAIDSTILPKFPDYTKDSKSSVLKIESKNQKDMTNSTIKKSKNDAMNRHATVPKRDTISESSSPEGRKYVASYAKPEYRSSPKSSESKLPDVFQRLTRKRSSSPRSSCREGRRSATTMSIRSSTESASVSPNVVELSTKKGSDSGRVASGKRDASTIRADESKSPDLAKASCRSCSVSPQYFGSDSDRSASVLMVTPETIAKPKAELACSKKREQSPTSFVAKGGKFVTKAPGEATGESSVDNYDETARRFIRSSVSRFFSEQCEAAARNAEPRKTFRGSSPLLLTDARTPSPTKPRFADGRAEKDERASFASSPGSREIVEGREGTPQTFRHKTEESATAASLRPRTCTDVVVEQPPEGPHALKRTVAREMTAGPRNLWSDVEDKSSKSPLSVKDDSSRAEDANTFSRRGSADVPRSTKLIRDVLQRQSGRDLVDYAPDGTSSDWKERSRANGMQAEARADRKVGERAGTPAARQLAAAGWKSCGSAEVGAEIGEITTPDRYVKQQQSRGTYSRSSRRTACEKSSAAKLLTYSVRKPIKQRGSLLESNIFEHSLRDSADERPGSSRCTTRIASVRKEPAACARSLQSRAKGNVANGKSESDVSKTRSRAASPTRARSGKTSSEMLADRWNVDRHDPSKRRTRTSSKSIARDSTRGTDMAARSGGTKISGAGARTARKQSVVDERKKGKTSKEAEMLKSTQLVRSATRGSDLAEGSGKMVGEYDAIRDEQTETRKSCCPSTIDIRKSEAGLASIKQLPKNYERTDSVESALRRFDSIGTEAGSIPGTLQRSVESIPMETRRKSGGSIGREAHSNTICPKAPDRPNLSLFAKGEPSGSCARRATTASRSAVAAARGRRAGTQETRMQKKLEKARDSIEIARIAIRSRSLSCKRKLFQHAGSSEATETGSVASRCSLDSVRSVQRLCVGSNRKKTRDSLNTASKRFESSGSDETSAETIDKGQAEKTSTAVDRCSSTKQLRSIEDIRRSIEDESWDRETGQASVTSTIVGGASRRLRAAEAAGRSEPRRINSDDRAADRKEISSSVNVVANNHALGDTDRLSVKCSMRFSRVAKSPSPETIKETSRTRRNVPASPSKSPDTVARRASSELKAQDTRSTRRPTTVKGSEPIGNRKATSTTTKKSADVVDSAILENGVHLRDQTAETKYDNDSPTKKSDALVVDLDEQPPKENDAPLARKPLLRKQSTEKQVSSMQSTRPPSVSSVSAGSPMQGQTSGHRSKMASRAKTPVSGSTAYKGSAGSRPAAAAATTCYSDALVPCKMCGRRFAQDRVTLHEQICAKTTQKKRKQFDTMMYRVKGTDLEPFVKKGLVKKQVEKSKKPEIKSNWRRKHEDFINAIRSAKQVQAHLAAGGKLSDLPPPPVSDNCDYIQCPHCGRKFNKAAAERHIPKCEHMLHNKPIHSRAPKPRR